MTVSFPLLTLLIAIPALVAWFGVFKIVPDCQHSLYRYKLWHLHDELYAALDAGKLPSSSAVLDMQAMIDGAIRSAETFTLGRLLLLRWLPASRDYWSFERHFAFEGLSLDEFRLLCSIADRYNRATATHLFTSSPLAWWIFPAVATMLWLSDGFAEWVRRTGDALLDALRADAADRASAGRKVPALVEE